MDRHKGGKAGFLHIDELAVNSICMGFISFCTLAAPLAACAMQHSPPTGSHLHLASLSPLGDNTAVAHLHEYHFTASP